MINSSVQNVDFSNELRFVEFDNRKNRGHSNINTESLNKRHRALLPKSEVRGKSILDLGSTIGATGYWCLENGATHYTGIEIQSLYCNQSQEIFSSLYEDQQFTIIQSSIEDFLKKNKERYDVVVLSGILYAFLDVVEILKSVAKIAKETIVIDSLYPRGIKGLDDTFIGITKFQAINSSLGNFSYVGIGARPTPEALNIIMKNFGFEFMGLRFPESMESKQIDAYYKTISAHDFKFPLRFMTGFKKRLSSHIDDVDRTSSENVQNNSNNQELFNRVTHKIYSQEPIGKINSWSFENKEVIKNFQEIATTSIPNYEVVIEKLLRIAKRKFPDSETKIVDVGSSRGYTLQKFYNSGYRNLFGIENSKGMLKKSFQKATLIHSATFPEELIEIDMIMANWTIHFTKDRKEYISKIYAALSEGGVFILSEKIASSDIIHNLYHDFKRHNGLTEEQIKEKEDAVKGILVPYPMEWYMQLLKEVGFNEINIIDADFSFITFYCIK